MTPLVIAALAVVPCVYWTQGVESRAALEAAGITRLCVAPEQVDAWRAAGFTATAIAEADFKTREPLAVPGTAARAGVASPTRSPWVAANGWRFVRQPDTKYVYEVPAGKGALAAAEAFAYGGDAVLEVDAADLAAVGAMLTFLESLPADDLPPIADFAIVDDGSPVTGEVMNLLSRRNLLYQIVTVPSSQYPITIAIGSPTYPAEEAADPSSFAQKIRRQLTDDRRSLRVYGSEVVIGRLTGTAGQARLHLLNYGGREIEGLRLRVRGAYATGEAYVAGAGRLPLADHVVADGATEFSLPRLAAYAVIDLKASKE